MNVDGCASEREGIISDGHLKPSMAYIQTLIEYFFNKKWKTIQHNNGYHGDNISKCYFGI
jgi:hypothetical protein